MSERDDATKGFTVIDRRGRVEEEPAAAPSETLPPPAPGAPAEPKVDFSVFVQSVAISALHYLGLTSDPATGRPAERDLPLARHNIEILEMLEAKTRGNLSQVEADLLATLLYEVRMHFVEAAKSPGG